MAARFCLKALLVLRPPSFLAYSATHRLQNANHLRLQSAHPPSFCNISANVAFQRNLSSGNPRFLSSAAATNFTDSESASALNFLRNETNPQRIREVFDRPCDDPALHPRLLVYRLAVKKLRRAKAFDVVEEILEKILEESQPLTELTAISVIKFYGYASMPDHALKTFQRLNDLGISPSLKSFNTLLAALTDAGKFEMVRDLFNKIGDFGFSPSVYTFNINLKALCEIMDYDSAFRILGTMKEKGCEPSMVSYNTIMDSLYFRLKHKQIGADKVEAFMDKLLECSTSETFYHRIQMKKLCEKSSADAAFALLQEVISKGLSLDHRILNNLAMVLYKDGKQKKAKEVLGMIEDRKERSPVVSNMLVRYYVNNGDLDTAMELCKDLFVSCRIPDIATVNVLMDSLMKSGKVQTDAAQFIIDRARKNMPDVMIQWDSNLQSLQN